MTLKLNVRY